MTGNERDETDTNAPHGAADAALERAWHDTSAEQPSAALDAAIVAAARESLSRAGHEPSKRATARPRSWSPFARWQPLAVAASVAGLAFVLAQVLPREPSIAPAGMGEPQAGSSEFGAARSSAPRRAQQLEVPDVPAAPAAAAPTAGDAAPVRRPFELADRAPAAGPASASVAEQSVTASKSVRADVEAMDAAPAAAARENPGAEPRTDADAWAARIAALHAAGDLDAAAASLRRFRAVYGRTDEFLPPPLRDWARTVE